MAATLLVEIGNSSVKWNLSNKSVDDNQVFYYQHQPWSALWQLWQLIQPAKVYCAAVAIKAKSIIQQYWQSRQIDCHNIISQEYFDGLHNGYTKATQLGVDRWLACIGARQKFGQHNFLIVDAGTALTIDVVTEDGQHFPGGILPGRGWLQRFYQERLAPIDFSLTDISVSEPLKSTLQLEVEKQHFVKNSFQAARVGMVLPTLQALFFYQQQCKLQISQATILLLTGGDAAWLQTYLDKNWQLVPNLVLAGLKKFYQIDCAF